MRAGRGGREGNAAFGTVFFDSGETSKTLRGLVDEDSIGEETWGERRGESFNVDLRDAIGGFFVGARATASVLIIEDTVGPSTDAIDGAGALVRGHRHDFLDRDPDATGLAFRAHRRDS